MGEHEHSTGYRTQSPDTDEWVEHILFDHWRRLEPWEKARIVTDLCRATHRLQLVGLAARHPRASAEELELRAACARIGRANVERALGRPLPFVD